MSRFYRTVCLLLALLLTLLSACTGKTANSTSESTKSTAPDLKAIFSAAAEALNAKPDLKITVVSEIERIVNGQVFKEKLDREAQFRGLASDAITGKTVDRITLSGKTFDKTETYSDGKIYADMKFIGDEKQGRYVSEMDKDTYLSRQYPTVLLTAECYDSVSLSEDGTRLLFSNPIAPEKWFATESTELISAEGEALITDGALTQTVYRATYRQSASEVTMTVTSTATVDTADISGDIPENAKEYATLDDIDAPFLMARAYQNLCQADSVSTQSLYVITSYAAGIVSTLQSTAGIYMLDSEPVYQLKNSLNLTDNSGSNVYTYEESYADGILKSQSDDEEIEERHFPSSELRPNFYELFTPFISQYYMLDDARLTDADDCWLIDFSLLSDYGAGYKDLCASKILAEPSILDEKSSAYATTKLQGYISLEKDTYLPTAYHLSYAGTHTIEGSNYPLSLEYDLGLKTCNRSIYQDITDELLPEEKPEFTATPLFYEVTGKSGEKMYLLGTIHVGDERTGFLPDEIYTAFKNSDALAVEFDSDAFEEEIENNEELSEKIAKAYYYSDGTTISNHIDSELHEKAVLAIKKSGNYNTLAEYAKAFLWAQEISNFYIFEGRRLSSVQGVDSRLLKMAREQRKEILNVESGEAQITMLSNYSDDVQEYMLLSALNNTSYASRKQTEELYDLWCKGDENELISALNDNKDEISKLDEDELAIYREYTKVMMTDRNTAMLEIAKGYLKGNKTVFYAVGLAHLLAGDGLLNGLRAAGYTVTQVSFG